MRMFMEGSEALVRLQEIHPLTGANFDQFEELLEEATRDRNPTTLKPLLLLLDDGCRVAGAMESLASALEFYPVGALAEALLEVAPELVGMSPRWAGTEVKKFLWTDSLRAVLKEAATRATTASRSALSSIVRRIRNKVPELAEACDDVLLGLEQEA
jgi:hypothetical protein